MARGAGLPTAGDAEAAVDRTRNADPGRLVPAAHAAGVPAAPGHADGQLYHLQRRRHSRGLRDCIPGRMSTGCPQDGGPEKTIGRRDTLPARLLFPTTPVTKGLFFRTQQVTDL